MVGVLQGSSGDITSTDELVMVLTDHDYQEEQEGENSENSNIVVLYSHPVDGQQSQFITSQVRNENFTKVCSNSKYLLGKSIGKFTNWSARTQKRGHYYNNSIKSTHG